MPNKHVQIDEEINYAKKLTKIVKNNIKVQEKSSILKQINKIEWLLEDGRINKTPCINDPQAKIGRKENNKWFVGYKTHIGMTEDSIITAVRVTTREKVDGKSLGELVEMTKRNGVEVKEVIGDRAYSSWENLEYLNKNGINAIARLNPVISNGKIRENNKFEYVKDADMMMCPAGHLSYKKNFQDRSLRCNSKKGKINNVMRYFFDIKKCKQCDLKDGCYKDGAKSKSYVVTLLSDLHKKQKDFESSPYFKLKSKERYKIEAKNSELKQCHGLDRCKYSGLFAMQLQAYFSVFVCNSKRIVKLRGTLSA